MPSQGYVGTTALENCCQFRRLVPGNNRVLITRTDENGKITKIANNVGDERHHGSEQHGGCEVMGMQQNQTSSDVGAVRIANGDQLFRLEIISRRGGVQKLRQFVCAKLKVLHVEDPFGKPAKE